MDKTKVVNSVIGKWTAQVTEVDGKSLNFTITSPANAFIGRYGVFIETGLKLDDQATRRFEMEDDEIFMIFNPWCKGE